MAIFRIRILRFVWLIYFKELLSLLRTFWGRWWRWLLSGGLPGLWKLLQLVMTIVWTTIIISILGVMRDQIKAHRAVGWFAAPVVGSGGRRRAALCYQSWRAMMCRMFMNDQCSINRMFKNKRWKKILSKFIYILILIFLIWSSSFREFGPKSRFYNQDFLRKWVSPPNFRYGCMAKFLMIL